jgi:hypothetical protein
VAAPTAPVPDADVAAASICSIMPRTTAGQTRTEAVALRLGRSSTAGSILGKKLGSKGLGFNSIRIFLLHFFP